jgi:hypothetical protein
VPIADQLSRTLTKAEETHEVTAAILAWWSACFASLWTHALCSRARRKILRSEEQVGEERYGRHESEQHPQREGQAAAAEPLLRRCHTSPVAVDLG